jgi:hypothetical protein
MATRISRVGVDSAALHQILPLIPAALVNAANQHTTTQGVNALYDYLRSLLGQQGQPLSTLAARQAFTALRNLIPRRRFGLPRDRLPDVDRERALIVHTAGRVINERLAATTPAAPPPPPPPTKDDDNGDDEAGKTPMWMIDPRLRDLAPDADPESVV